MTDFTQHFDSYILRPARDFCADSDWNTEYVRGIAEFLIDACQIFYGDEDRRLSLDEHKEELMEYLSAPSAPVVAEVKQADPQLELLLAEEELIQLRDQISELQEELQRKEAEFAQMKKDDKLTSEEALVLGKLAELWSPRVEAVVRNLVIALGDNG